MRHVLVTGGSGFLAGWIIRRLLERGDSVRMSVRSEERADEVRRMLSDEGVITGALTSVCADLAEPDGWDAAMEGIDCVLHVASPLGGESHDDPALIETACTGVRHVMGAALRAGVRKVVMTSSAAAVFPGRADTRQDIDESFWTDMKGALVTNYMRSKTMAEITAWDLVASQEKMALVTILPGAIFGPFMGGRHSSTELLFTTLLRGSPSPKATFQVVDVRDLADLHIIAMENPRADGHRFIAQPDEITMPAMAALMKQELGRQGSRISTAVVPDVIIKVGALFSPAMRVMNTLIGMKHRHNAGKAAAVLGWQPRPVRDTVLDAARYAAGDAAAADIRQSR